MLDLIMVWGGGVKLRIEYVFNQGEVTSILFLNMQFKPVTDKLKYIRQK